MIQGKKKVQITADMILEKISAYDIFRFYLGNFRIGKAFKSPFRRDNHPSFAVRYSKSGELYYLDYGDDSFKGNCFKLVQQLWSLNYQEALEKIDKDFGLGITGGKLRNYQRIISQYEKPDACVKETKILVISRPFTKEELAYWNQYHISRDDLKKANIYGIDKIYLNKRILPNYDKLIKFGYFYEPYWKIYTPHAKKGKKFFPNNVPKDQIDGFENLKQCEKGIITKSKKDYMVIQKIFPQVCAVQNESTAAFNETTVSFIKENCQQPYIAFDNDPPGKKASMVITQEYGWKHINVPDKYLEENITDFADLGKQYGLDAVAAHFSEKGLI